MKIGIFGAGFSGKAIGAKMAAHGLDVWGTTRSAEKAQALEEDGITSVLFDGKIITPDILETLATTTHLIISIAPPRQENTEQPDTVVDPVLLALDNHDLKAIAPQLEWVGYLSTVGVYGNHDGIWVDEGTEAAPASERSRQRVRAEAEWLSVGEATGLPVGIFRLSGIYGPGRNALVSAHKGKARRLVKPGQVFNRIHVVDIAEALYLAADKRAKGLFNITDNEPAPPQDVVEFAHRIMGKEAPPEMDFATADLTPMARSFYGENKRVSNAKSVSELGLKYRFGNYRIALQSMWDDGTWQG